MMSKSHDDDAQRTPSKRIQIRRGTPPGASKHTVSPGGVLSDEFGCSEHFSLPGSRFLKSFNSSHPVECDGCGGYFVAGSELFGCRRCNFDLCQACYADAVDAGGLTGISADASALTSKPNPTDGKDALQNTARGQCINKSLLEQADAPQLAVAALRSWMLAIPPPNPATNSGAPRAVCMGISRLNMQMLADEDSPDSNSTHGKKTWKDKLHRACLAECLGDLCLRWPKDDQLLESALDALTLLAKEEVVVEAMAAHAASYIRDTDRHESSNTLSSNSGGCSGTSNNNAMVEQIKGAPAVLKLALRRTEKASAEWKHKIFASSFSLVGQMVLSEGGVGGWVLLSLCPVVGALKEALTECATSNRDQMEIEEMVKYCGNAIYNLGHSGTDGSHAKLLCDGGIVEAAIDVCRALSASGVVHHWALGAVEAIIRFHEPALEIAVQYGLEKVANLALKRKFKKGGPYAHSFARNCLNCLKGKRIELEKQKYPSTASPSPRSSKKRRDDAKPDEGEADGADTKKTSPRFSARIKINSGVQDTIEGNDNTTEKIDPVTNPRKPSTSPHQADSAVQTVTFDTEAPKPPPGASQTFTLGFRGAVAQSSSGSRAHSDVSASATSYFESRSNHGRPSSQASFKRPGKHVSQRLGDRKLLKLGVRSTTAGSGTVDKDVCEGESAEYAEIEGDDDEDSSQHRSQSKRGRGDPPLLVYPARGEKLLPMSKQAPHAASVKQLFDTHKQRFGEWQSLLLRGGFNLLLYGFGSKHALLTAFREEAMRSTLMVEAKGWEATTSSETVLDVLAHDILNQRDRLYNPDPVVYARNVVAWLGPLKPRPPPGLTWDALRSHAGWTWAPGNGIESNYQYLRPGVGGKGGVPPGDREVGVHVFLDEDSAISFARHHGVDFTVRFGHVSEPPFQRARRPAKGTAGGPSSSSSSSRAEKGGGGGEENDDDEEEDARRDPLEFVGLDNAVTSAAELAAAAASGGGGGHEVVVLLVHSLDGSPLLRTRTHQTALAVLAASPRIRLVASVDHVNAGLLWDADLAASFRWVAQDATTYATFDLEASRLRERHCALARAAKAKANKKLKIGDTGAAGTDGEDGEGGDKTIEGDRGREHVLESFTDRHIRLLKLLAAQSQPGNGYAGMTVSELQKAAQRALIAKTQAELDPMLQEFRDHNFLVSSKDRGNKASRDKRERLTVAPDVCDKLQQIGRK